MRLNTYTYTDGTLDTYTYWTHTDKKASYSMEERWAELLWFVQAVPKNWWIWCITTITLSPPHPHHSPLSSPSHLWLKCHWHTQSGKFGVSYKLDDYMSQSYNHMCVCLEWRIIRVIISSEINHSYAGGGGGQRVLDHESPENKIHCHSFPMKIKTFHE